MAILTKMLIDTMKPSRTRVSYRSNRLLNSKFVFNYISTPFCKEKSLKYEPAMCRAFLIHGLAYPLLEGVISYYAIPAFGGCDWLLQSTFSQATTL